MGGLWHPHAVRKEHINAGGFQGGGKKIVWHTTEGTSLPNYGGSAPHFTLDPEKGSLWQHIPLNRAGRALVAGGPNFWNAIQIELIGYAKETHRWSADRYQRIAALARWIEANFGVPRSTSVTFAGNGGTPHLASTAAFRDYAGHLGHQHVPGNTHWDPGQFKIELVLDGKGSTASTADAAPAVPDLGRGDKGEEVEALQHMLVKRGYKILAEHVDGHFTRATEAFVVHFQWQHKLNVDGVVGERTRTALGLHMVAAHRKAGEPVKQAVERVDVGLGEPLTEHVHVAKE